MAEQTMDEAERLRRMQTLQMADLGTARREYISTSDIPNKNHRVSQAQVEAQRASNIPGSESHRLAETNQSQLNAWNEAWKTIGADIKMEELDSMMNGQTHRAQLTQLIMEKSGQGHLKPIALPTGPSRGQKAVRSGFMHGRGGGMAGTRVRKPLVPNSKPAATKTGPTPSTSSKRPEIPLPRKPEPQRPGTVKVFQDPSKDCNNPADQTASNAKKRGSGSFPKPRAPVVKTRRPIPASNSVNFETLLADSSTFMAAIPGMAPGSSPNQTQEVTEKSNNDGTGYMNRAKGSSVTADITKSEVVPAISKPKPKLPDIKIHVITSLSTGGLNKATDSVTQKIDHGFGTCLPQPQVRNPASGDSFNQLINSLETRRQGKASNSNKFRKPKPSEVKEIDLLDMDDEPDENESPVVKLPVVQPEVKKAPVIKLPRVSPEVKKAPVEISDPAQELEKILQILACPSELTPFAVDYFEWRKHQLTEEISSMNAAIPPAKKEGENRDIIDLDIDDGARQSSTAPAPGPSEKPKDEELTLISIETETEEGESEYETAGGDADDEADEQSDGELIGGETDASSSGQGVLVNREMEDITIETEDSTIGPISSANWEQSNQSLIGESAVSREVKKTQQPKETESDNLIGSRWLPGQAVQSEDQLPPVKRVAVQKSAAVFEIKEDADVLAAAAAIKNEPAPIPTPKGLAPTTSVPPTSISTSPAAKVPTQILPTPTTPVRTTPVPVPAPITTPTLPQAPTISKIEPPRRPRLPMREVPNFPISAATMQYFSGRATQDDGSTVVDENAAPDYGNANPQTHRRKTSSSSGLSPAAPTFRPNLVSRPKANNVETPQRGHSGRQSSQHSQLTSPSPKANTNTSQQISKTIFVIEMEKRGITVDFADHERDLRN